MPDVLTIWNFFISEHSAQFWRIFAIIEFAVLAIILILYKMKILMYSSNIKKDQELFTRLNALANEDSIRDFLEQLETEDAYNSTTRQKISSFAIELGKTENQYLSKKIEKSKKCFYDKLRLLFDFLAVNFFVHPSIKNRFCLYPNLNVDIEGSSNEDASKYIGFRNQLDGLVEEARRSFESHRHIILHKLKI